MIRGMRRPSDGGHAAEVQGWLRRHFALDGAIIVSELRCTVPGCPPIETVALFWDAAGTAYCLRIFKPLAEVGPDDLPPAWYLPALVDEGEADCGCC